MRELYADALRRAGHQVIERPDARHLTELVARAQPFAVVLDWSLPGSSGVVACARLKRRRDTAHVRVAMLTAHPSLELEHEAARARADCFLVKPVSPAELFAAIEQK